MNKKRVGTKERVLTYLGKHHWKIISLIAALFLIPATTIWVQSWLDESLTKTKTQYFYSEITRQSDTYEYIATDAEAYCQESNYSQRSDAWRCFNGNLIYDPCFKSSNSIATVVCPRDPEGLLNAIEIKDYISLDELYEVDKSNREQVDPSPWFIVLANGARCFFIGGVTYEEADLRANYGCNTEFSVFGAINDESDIWTIRCENRSMNRLEECMIREAWF